MRGARPDHALGVLFLRAQPFDSTGKLIVAVSGGSDSVALAGLAASHAGATKLIFVHVNHGLRPSAAQDEAVVLALGARLHVPVNVVMLKPTTRDEAHLRDLRYTALLDVAMTVGATSICTGHTAQDQTETVLLALFRGTGRDGLCGMSVNRQLAEGISLKRPLLRADRASLQRYCERQHLPYAVDPSNTDESYTRNALRRHLAELRPAFPGLDRAVARCAELLRSERDGEAEALSRQAIRSALQNAGLSDDLTFERIDAAARLLEFSHGRSIRISARERRDDL